MYEDTYFLNSAEALRVAKQQNKPSRYVLQVCYYTGEKIESDCENLIHLPIENLVNDLAKGIYRLPTKLDFTGLELSAAIKLDIVQNFESSLEQARDYRNQYNAYYLKALKNAKPDFSEPLRFYLPASSNTQVMQHISENIATTLKKLGYEVFFDLQIGITDPFSVKRMLEFNPHVTININHMNTNHISDDVFNFVWFQDSMPIVNNEEALKLREKDYLFALLPGVVNALKVKKAKNCRLQNFCISTDIYKQYSNIERKKKIVFIGSSYKDNFMPYESSCGGKAIDIIDDKATDDLLKELIDIYQADGRFTKDIKIKLSEKYNKSTNFIHNYAIPLVVRDISILKLCKMNIKYDIEIYGWGWEKYEELKAYYKGVLEYGKEISEVYNSAAYALVSHPYYLIQQRTLEAAASGCIPLVYDCRYLNETEPPYYENSIVLFQNLDTLENILNEKPKNMVFQEMLDDHTYESFIKKILKIISTAL